MGKREKNNFSPNAFDEVKIPMNLVSMIFSELTKWTVDETSSRQDVVAPRYVSSK
jgi:hypothetical protein